MLFSFLLFNPAEGTEKSPFVWVAEKGGKASYLLGVIHVGISLKDMPCSDQVLNQIENSDLLFMEFKVGDEVAQLSEEEKKKFFIGSREEQERVLSKLSLESQEVIKERKEILNNILRGSLPFQVYSTTERAFSELSRKSQNFLIEHGADPEGNHADFFHLLMFVAHMKANLSFPSLDRQIAKTALSQSIKIEALDDNKKIYGDIRSQTPSNKLSKSVSYMDIEELIGAMDILVKQNRDAILQVAQVYKTYDADFFKNRLNALQAGAGVAIDEEVLLKNRNELWLKKFIEAHTGYESIFLAAGLSHLIGSYNLLDMLEKNGFSVERMTCSK